jgi:hypothetical protein
VAALLDFIWVWSDNIVTDNAVHTAAAAAADADDAARAAALARLEANMAAHSGAGAVFWMALFGTLLAPEQALTCFISMRPWMPTLIGVHSGVVHLQAAGAWPP